MTKRKYAGSSGYRKRRNTRRSRFIRWAKSASAQSRQIQTNNRRLNAVQARLKKDTQRYGLTKEFISSGLTDKVLLIAPALTAGTSSPSWSNCFANNTNALLANRVRLGRCHVKMQFTSANERSPITYSIFHVRLNPKNAEYVISQYGDNLATLSSPLGFIRGTTPVAAGDASGGGNVMLNPDWFIVKKQWRFTLAQYVATDDTGQPQRSSQRTGSGTLKNIDYSFPMGYTLGKGVGSWGDVPADKDTAPHLRNYFMVFSDNIGTDLQYNQYSILCQCTASYQ